MSHTGALQIEMMNETTNDSAKRIAELNDTARRGVSGPVSLRQGKHVKYVMTGGVACLGMEIKACALTMLACFETFDKANDPNEHHEFGTFHVKAQKFHWKFDYYAMSNGRVDWEHGSEDPSDSEKTMRVLTLMLGEEY